LALLNIYSINFLLGFALLDVDGVNLLLALFDINGVDLLLRFALLDVDSIDLLLALLCKWRYEVSLFFA
jgi:hypothetical protein